MNTTDLKIILSAMILVTGLISYSMRLIKDDRKHVTHPRSTGISPAEVRLPEKQKRVA